MASSVFSGCLRFCSGSHNGNRNRRLAGLAERSLQQGPSAMWQHGLHLSAFRRRRAHTLRTQIDAAVWLCTALKELLPQTLYVRVLYADARCFQ
jgi:hypothetical protein